MKTTYQPPPGWKCRNCGAVSVQETPRSCARCLDLAFSPVVVREEMVKLAERHGAAIELVHAGNVLEALGGVGCLLRYQQGWRPGQP